MLAYLRFFYGLILMRNTPQQLPFSNILLWGSVFGLFALSVIEGALIFPFFKNIAFNAFDLALLLIFLHFLLKFYRHSARFTQTVTAVCGAGVIFRLLELPAYLLLVSGYLPKDSELYALASLLLVLLLVYSVFVVAHILKHALSSTMLVSVPIVIIFYAVNFYIIRLVFPQ